jgi:hypothetical protein
MNTKLIGPLFSWTILFGIGTLFKYAAFHNSAVWFEIAPQATLWATGIFFTTAVADATFSPAKVLPKYTRKVNGLGYEMNYEVTLPESYDPSSPSKYLYFFLGSLGAWILNVFISGKIVTRALPHLSAVGDEASKSQFDLIFFVLLFLSVSIASGVIVFALRAFREVSR